MQLFQIVPFPSSAMVTIGYIIRIISAQCCYGVTRSSGAVRQCWASPGEEMENVTDYSGTDIPEYNVAILVSERGNIRVSVN